MSSRNVQPLEYGKPCIGERRKLHRATPVQKEKGQVTGEVVSEARIGSNINNVGLAEVPTGHHEVRSAGYRITLANSVPREKVHIGRVRSAPYVIIGIARFAEIRAPYV